MADEFRIALSSVRPVVPDSVVAPIGDELEQIFAHSVSRHPQDHEPPAAGYSEIAVIASITGGVGLLYKLFEPLVTDLGERFRDRVLEMCNVVTRRNEQSRVYTPLEISFGTKMEGEWAMTPVRYYFHGRMDAEELLFRLQAAHDHLQSIPPEMFEGLGGPGENGFFWDGRERRWRGNVWISPDKTVGEEWLPPDLWEP